MAFSDAFLQELKSRAEISTIISRYVNLRKSGGRYVGLCPFHSEKTPSFTVYEDTQNFYCFGCGVGGDIITFIRKIENLDYVDAVKMLAQQCGMEIPAEAVNDSYARLRKRILEMNREAAKFFHNCLKSPAGRAGLDYFKKRKLLPSTITSFGLGYAPNSWNALKSHLGSLGYSDEEMHAAALIRMKGTHGYDQFRNRVMFPIIDLQGNVIGFGGRVLDDSTPKYLNTSDTPVFKKSMNLYALNFAKSSGMDSLILCEGYMDVIAMHQAGFKNAVATLGTALTPEQARLIARYTKEITVSYDADEAGQKAAQRAIGLLTQVGLRVRVLHIEGGKDPDEFLKSYGADKFKLMLENAGTHIEYRISGAKAKYNMNEPEQKLEFIKEAEEIIASLESAIEREVYAGKLAQELELNKDTLLGEINRIRLQKDRRDLRTQMRSELAQIQGLKDRVNPEKSRYLRVSNAEESLIAILYKNPDFLKKLDELINPDDFVTEFNRRVYSTERELIQQNETLDMTSLGAVFEPEQTGRILRMTMRPVSNTIEEAIDCVNVILQTKQRKAESGLDVVDRINELRQKKLEKYRRENK